MRSLTLLVSSSLLLVAATGAPAAGRAEVEGPAGGYVEPVTGVVIDTFRPPEHPYGPGNLGWEYATVPGAVAVAPADGVVVFAGPVAGTRAVTIRHLDGLRTSVTHLARVGVATGARVRRGAPIGRTGPRTHLGVRDLAGVYLDPGLLFGVLVRRTRLVPGGDDGTVHRSGHTVFRVRVLQAASMLGRRLRTALAPPSPAP